MEKNSMLQYRVRDMLPDLELDTFDWRWAIPGPKATETQCFLEQDTTI